MYIKFNATVIGIETWYWVTVNGCMRWFYPLSVHPFHHSSSLTYLFSLLSFLFFVSLCFLPFSIPPSSSSSSSSVSVFLGANHRALEGAAGEGGERERRGDGVQQEGAEGVEGESFPAAGWPCWPRGRTHTRARVRRNTHTHIHICSISQKTLSSTSLSPCRGDVIDLSLLNRPSNPPAVRAPKDNSDKTVTFPWQQYAKNHNQWKRWWELSSCCCDPCDSYKTAQQRQREMGEEAENDNTFSDDVVSLFAAARLCRKVSINHFRKAVYVFNTVSAQRFK